MIDASAAGTAGTNALTRLISRWQIAGVMSPMSAWAVSMHTGLVISTHFHACIVFFQAVTILIASCPVVLVFVMSVPVVLGATLSVKLSVRMRLFWVIGSVIGSVIWSVIGSMVRIHVSAVSRMVPFGIGAMDVGMKWLWSRLWLWLWPGLRTWLRL